MMAQSMVALETKQPTGKAAGGGWEHLAFEYYSNHLDCKAVYC